MGDLSYGDVYAIPYWEYLDPTGLRPEDCRFIQEGCLVMILAMAWAQIDGACSYIRQFLQQIQQCLNSLVIQDELGQRLLNAVKLAV
ncbi:MAG: hypothetical protein JXB13_06325 [Phycisphaerae bacterium]|nr:hypothetical protein [Phycisphaerae bacterium]